MLQQKSDESFMCSQWRTMNDQWSFCFIILCCVLQFETAALCKINLVGCQSKFSSNGAPYLHVYFGSVKCSLIRNFYIRCFGFNQNVSYQFFCFYPQFRL